MVDFMANIPETAVFSFKRVSCADDPSDIRPALHVLTQEIERRAAAGSLVVLMGEDHSVPLHKILRQGLLARLLQTSSSLAYGMERPHDLLGALLENKCGQPVAPSLRVQLGRSDYDGQKLSRAFRALLSPVHTPFTGKNLLAFLAENKISIRANDAATVKQDKEVFLDLNDPLTQRLIAQHKPHLQGLPVSVTSADGIALRNHMIVDCACAHMKETGAHIYVQDCGMGHLLGHQSARGVWPYADSLSALFAQAGMDVLPVFTTDFIYNYESLPAGAAAMLAQQGLALEELKTTRLLAFMCSPDMEKRFMDEVNANSADEIKIYPEASREENEQEKQRIIREIPHWLRQAGIKP